MSLLGGALGALKATLGVDKSPAHIETARRRACESCPALLASGRCGDCGCIVALKARVRAEGCPRSLWPS